MKRALFCLVLCLIIVGPGWSQTTEGPVWEVFQSIHSTISDGTESVTQRTDNLRMYNDFASPVDHDTMRSGSEWLSQNNGIGCICHPARDAVAWSNPGVRNEQILPCVEILNKYDYHWSDKWLCAEGSGCTTYNNPSPPNKAYWSGSVKSASDSGLRLGFFGAWDYHGSYPGIPSAYTGPAGAAGWTKEAVFEAIRKRHTWAAEDYIRMGVTSGPYVMGDAFVTSEQVVLINYDIWAAPGKTITDVSIFVDGVITKVHRFTRQENVIGSFEIGLSENDHYVFIEAIQSDGKRAWSSPMYITIPEPVPGPCGTVITWEGWVGGDSDDAEEALINGEVYWASTDLELINDPGWRGEQIVGIRFSGVDFPQRPTIHNVYIQFKVDKTSSEATSLRIVGQDIDNATTFGYSTGNISSRVRTEAETWWSPAAWTKVGEAGLNQRTPDISSVINEIINRPGWSRGNSIVILITGTWKRVAFAYEGDPYGAPLLHVAYSTECSGNNPITT